MERKENKAIDQEKLDELYNPYSVKIDAEEAKTTCELCQGFGCCPEHCCDWDTCECGDCNECQPKAKK